MTSVQHILCPTDFSAPAHKALDYAVGLAATFGARILLLHVMQPATYPGHGLVDLPGFPNLQAEVRRAVDRELETLRARAAARVPVTVAVREGIPHDQIVDAAEQSGCDLVVMATQGRTGLQHLLLGSTAERVVRLSRCPVLTLRADDTPRQTA